MPRITSGNAILQGSLEVAPIGIVAQIILDLLVKLLEALLLGVASWRLIALLVCEVLTQIHAAAIAKSVGVVCRGAVGDASRGDGVSVAESVSYVLQSGSAQIHAVGQDVVVC